MKTLGFLVACSALIVACGGAGSDGDTVPTGDPAVPVAEPADPVTPPAADTPSATCSTNEGLLAFLESFKARDAAAVMATIKLPFSADGGRWMTEEAELRKALADEMDRDRMVHVEQEPADLSRLAGGKYEWLEKVRDKHPGAAPFRVVATFAKDDGSEKKMSAIFFVAPDDCKIVGLDDCPGTECY